MKYNPAMPNPDKPENTICLCTKLKRIDVIALNHWEYVKCLFQKQISFIFKRFPEEYLRIVHNQKIQITNNKQITMTEIQNNKQVEKKLNVRSDFCKALIEEDLQRCQIIYCH